MVNAAGGAKLPRWNVPLVITLLLHSGLFYMLLVHLNSTVMRSYVDHRPALIPIAIILVIWTIALLMRAR